jgi:hypothetical protein
MIAAHIVGYVLIVYLCFCIAFGPEAPVGGFFNRITWTLSNFTVWFWALLVIAILCPSVGIQI